ncbi:glyoxalase-like protein [Breoghania corrubedonensis]|uniref:Glyoxalase-like protein n=1 Tax=Breoghania corrubedonensis TaxID=665038 RepID=A0A2T5VBM6_9HYPH|nr:VOC family protein [Breoghania corrubedonensis]PTW61164.1 glyoxalase-like protein [Breoghania corrubedonensis]
MRARGIDHIVHAVEDLEAAREAYSRLGFTLTPYAEHPWGTRNFLVQLDSAFLEVLEVVDPSKMEEADIDAFSFGAFNRDFLARGEGMSMLVLDSDDPDADRAGFRLAGLATYAPFSFERIAGQPDGSEARVAFDLTFTTDPALPDAGFFTCRNRYPENFWKAAYQRHANGACGIGGAILVMPRPADLQEFVEGFTGIRELKVTSFGIGCHTARGTFDVITPEGFTALYGEAYPLHEMVTPRFAAVRLTVDDPAAFADAARVSGSAVSFGGERAIIPASELHGMALIAERRA